MEITLKERKTKLTLMEVWFKFKEYHETDVYLIDDLGRILLTKLKEITLYGFGTTVNKFFMDENIFGEVYFTLYITQHHERGEYSDSDNNDEDWPKDDDENKMED